MIIIKKAGQDCISTIDFPHLTRYGCQYVREMSLSSIVSEYSYTGKACGKSLGQ